MRKIMMAVVSAATLGTAALLAAPAQAQTTPVATLAAALQNGQIQADYVQYRRYYGGGPRYYGRPAYGPRYGYNPRGYYRRDRGNALAAGALGLATGAIIGGALAQSQAQAAQPTYVVPDQSAVAYCSQRFRSYDPGSGTYLGYDGLRHACP